MMRACFLYPHPPPNSAVAQCRSQDSVVVPIFVAPRCPSHISFFRTAKNLKPSGSGKTDHSLEAVESSSPTDGIGVLPGVDEDDELCPVDCVREFNTEEEFSRILDKAKETHSLVVVDFYRTSCGSCKYIEQGFTKLCKGSGDEDAAVVFLKHNVIDEYDEQSEVAERLRIKNLCSQYHYFTFIKMVCYWKHFQPGTRRGFWLPSKNILRQLDSWMIS